MHSFQLRFVSLVLSVMLPCAAAAAATKPNVELHLSGSIVSVTNSTTTYLPIDRPLKAGETVRYTIVADNSGTAPAVGLVPMARVPERSVFVRVAPAASAVRVEYTLDGKEWSAQPTILVKNPDGTTHRVPAPLTMYKAVRWVVPGALAAKHSLTFAYEVQVQ
jgi:uncharacterized repeat protein (TIGR01451 family)